jgi:hypothetical protein
MSAFYSFGNISPFGLLSLNNFTASGLQGSKTHINACREQEHFKGVLDANTLDKLEHEKVHEE